MRGRYERKPQEVHPKLFMLTNEQVAFIASEAELRDPALLVPTAHLRTKLRVMSWTSHAPTPFSLRPLLPPVITSLQVARNSTAKAANC